MRSACTVASMVRRLAAAILGLTLVVGCTSPRPPTLPPAPTSTASLTPTPTPTQAPTPGLTPTPTVEPTRTASPQPPPATTGGDPRPPLGAPADEIGAHLDALSHIARSNAGIRAAGTPGYDGSVDYVADQLQRMFYDARRVPFEFTFFDEAEPVKLVVGDQQWSGPEWLHAMLYSASGDAAGALQPVRLTEDGVSIDTGGCDPGDWSDFVAGHIALLANGPCYRRDQVLLAQDAGAIAVIALYPHWEANQTRRPTLLDPDGITIPAIVAGSEPSSALLAAAAAGGSAQVTSEVTMTPKTIDNVIAQLGPPDSDTVVMLGGHLDSVLDGPGINDNGSGVATLLWIAHELLIHGPAVSVRIGFWGAEEFGDLGSAAYVSDLNQDELARIKAYINLDMVGSPNPVRYVYDDASAPAGSDQLTQALLDALAAAGKPGSPVDLGAGSDHYNFELAGIPSSGVFSGLAPLTESDVALFGGELGSPADACYHLGCDDRANVSIDSAVTLGSAVVKVVQGLAY
jgi:Zn-dependent M28 family amino/carboxypeptidase